MLLRFTGATVALGVQVQLIAGDYMNALGVRAGGLEAHVPARRRARNRLRNFAEQSFVANLGTLRGKARPDNTLLADGAPCRVVGVMPDGFLPPISASSRVDAWMPLKLDRALATNRADHFLMVLARLAPGVTQEQAQSRLDAEAQLVAAAAAELQGWGSRIVSLKDQITGGPNKSLFALAGAVRFFCC